ncbi:hypothetical protein WR25_02527 [Diploscapter pachys]|uniref:Guanylate kinase-like domain-containing protein n=1 Tax=Diploscapter pachys TaxID=2018661 RepID=A0A2A2JH92_9BILA|nr:hypothetical protein WR25_02527 [Diploscapter pachys]
MNISQVGDTTRPPKENEIDGEHYRFVTFEEFKALEENAMLLEHGTYKGSITFSIFFFFSLPAYFSRISNGFFALELSRSALRSLATEPLLPSKGLKAPERTFKTL